MPIKNLRLRIKAEDKASGTLKKVALGVIGINQALELAKKAVEAFKKAWEFAKEGAQIQLIRKRFDGLAESIGTTGSVLSRELAIALKGTMSEMEGLALATDFMSLGLVKNQDEAIRLTAIAGDLGMNMNQLVLTLTNMTTMRFDALGVQVDGFKEKVKALEEAGHDTAEAFRLAFMEQAEDQIKLVGSVADTAAGEIMQMEAAWKDWTDTQKEGFSKLAIPIIESINNQRDYNELLDELRGLYRANFLDMADYRDIVIDVGNGVLTEEEGTAKLIIVLAEARQQYLKLNPELHLYNQLQGKATELAKEAIEPSTFLALAQEILANGFNLSTTAIWKQIAALKAQEDAANRLASLMSGLPVPRGPVTGYEKAQQGRGGGGGGGGWKIDALGRQYKQDTSGFTRGPNYNSVGGNDEAILLEVRRLVDSLPVAIADAVERH